MFNNDLPESLYLQGEREAEIEQLRREEQGEITVMMDSDLPVSGAEHVRCAEVRRPVG